MWVLSDELEPVSAKAVALSLSAGANHFDCLVEPAVSNGMRWSDFTLQSFVGHESQENRAGLNSPK